MRKIKIYLAVLSVCCLQIAICSQLHAQGVGINTTGNPADNSAMLDVSSTNLGILIPRMTTAQMNAISSPATGLIIYNTDCNNLNYNAGTPGSPNWVTISSTAGTPGNITGSASVCANQTGITYSIAAVSGASSYNWTVPSGATITAGAGTSSITVTFGTNGGNVCVSAVNSCGTSNASCITVTLYGNLTAGTISSNQTICSGGTPSALTFTTPPTGGIGAYTYQWYNGTGSLGSASTNSTYSPGALTAAIITTESFDGTMFPPTGWATTVISDPDCPGASSLYCPFAWMRTTGGMYVTSVVNIPESPHSGAGEAWYDSWDAAVGDEAILVSPSFSETGNSGATVSFWMFATDDMPNADYVNFWYSTSPTQPTSTSGATLLGTVYQYNAVTGWYQHTYTIPSSVTSPTVWLIFDAVSDFEIEMYIDDVSWTAIPSTATTNYYCSVTSGCTVTTNTVTLSVNAMPPASITGTTTICSGNNTTLTASGGGTYLWSTGDNTAAITESPTSTTTYTVSVTNGVGCSTTASATVTVNTGVPTPPVAGTNIPSPTQIVWNWSPVSGATGYRWGTTSSYSSATDVGTNTSYTQTGLTCDSALTLYVWAYNPCGNSSYTTLTQTTSACGAPCGTQAWMSANLNVGTMVTQATTQIPGQKWCGNDVPAYCTIYGGFYEWATAMNISNTYNANWGTATLGAANEICNPCGPTTGHGGVTGICPTGYHVPSDLEWSQYEWCLDANLAPVDTNSATNTLNYFLTAITWVGSTIAGVGPGSKMKDNSGDWSDGTWSTNTSGFYALPAGYSAIGITTTEPASASFWSTTEVDGGQSWYRYLSQNSSQVFRYLGIPKSEGISVRCLQD